MKRLTGRVTGHYVGHPLHVLVLVASLALSGFAALSLFQTRTVAVLIWFVGAAVLHDVALVPLYTLADRGLNRVLPGRRRPLPIAPWRNYVRFPAAISALLFLVYLPSIARLSRQYTSLTALTADGYLLRWLAVTGALFLISGVAYAVRLMRTRPNAVTG